MADACRVYWGSHGCNQERGHDGPHRCDCADDPGFDPETREYYDDPGCFNVGAPPYYGEITRFYGEDATVQERGIKHLDHFTAVLSPQRTDDLKPGVKALIGQHLEWQAAYVLEREDSDQYAGQFACTPLTEQHPGFAWVPECDLSEVEPLVESYA